MEDAIGFIFFWGVWLLVPILIDGTTVFASAFGVFIQRWRDARSRATQPQDLPFYPFITVILPIYNSADTLEPCLRSIVSQTYPLDRVEVLLLNNGSRDNSFEVFNALQAELPLHMHWHSIINQGKAWAMNAGIHLASGQYIFNVDSDVVLLPDALLETVRYLEAHPKLGAITGAIQVLPAPQGSAASRKLLAACEFYEYLTAFLVGRQYQSLLANLYTLSGAFSVFRREVLL
ncbi:MAG: hypothetical protein OHK0052_24660 [Anaerolineales bacterium]